MVRLVTVQGDQGGHCIDVLLYSKNLNGEVGVKHVEAGVDEEVVDADWHQSWIKLELHLGKLKFDFYLSNLTTVNRQENCLKTVFLLQLYLFVVSKIE